MPGKRFDFVFYTNYVKFVSIRHCCSAKNMPPYYSYSTISVELLSPGWFVCFGKVVFPARKVSR